MPIDRSEFEDRGTEMNLSEIVRQEFEVDVKEALSVDDRYEIWFDHTNFNDALKVKEALDHAEVSEAQVNGKPIWIVVTTSEVLK